VVPVILLPRWKKGLLIAAAAIVSLAAGILILDTAVPGSAFYGGKRVLESTRGVLVFTDQGNAQFNMMLAFKRMDEAEILVGKERYSVAREALDEEKASRELSLKYLVAVTDKEVFDGMLADSEELRLRAEELNEILEDNELNES